MSTPASLKALDTQTASGKRTNNRQRIYALILKEPQTIATLEFHTGLKMSTVTARISELHDDGLVDFKDCVTETSKGQSWIIPVTEKWAQSNLRQLVLEKKKQAWIKRGKLNNWI